MFAEGLFLLGNRGALRCLFGVQLDEALLIFRNVVLVEDGFNRAFRHASFAVDAFIGMNVQNLLVFVEAFDGANNNAVSVLAPKARGADNVGHGSNSPADQTAKAIIATLGRAKNKAACNLADRQFAAATLPKPSAILWKLMMTSSPPSPEC
jgi:hypothetical protein